MPRVIEVKNLSKKYLLYHELQSAYSTLIETISSGTRRLFNSLTHPFRKNALPPRQASEVFWALKDVNVEVNEGDRIGIIGRNGAGKSTFLKILSRIIEPTSGSLKIHGRVASLLEVGTGFHPELTGRENVFLNGAILGMSRKEIEKKFDEIIAFAEIEQFLDTPVKRYSSGMYTRLGFAVAAHLDPDILIIDEVLAVGDMQFQEKCFQKIKDLSKSLKTVLFVTHNIQAIINLCNKGILFEKGRIKFQGSITDCANEYLGSYKLMTSNWKGDVGDDHLRLQKAYISSASPAKEYYTAEEQVQLNIEYEVMEEANDFILGFCLFNPKGQIVARSFIGDEAQIFGSYSKKGQRRLSFSFPLHYFRDDEYVIQISYSRGSKDIVRDQVGLKLPILSPSKTAYSMRNAPLDGIFLGGHWVME